MTNVLILGAGRVARPMVDYLLRRPDVQLTVATRTVSKAIDLIGGHAKGRAVTVDSGDAAQLSKVIAGADIAVSLLPATQHVSVAKLCIEHRVHMVTTSYVSPEMRALDAAARDAGVVILNELGVDPGIDHMSAMKIIDDVKRRGGKVTGFRSYCGGLPAPEANDNPMGYKVSWSPRAVLVAAGNSARYLKDGKLVEIPASELFTDCHTVEVPGAGTFEAYPNRDSLGYIAQYGLEGIATMYRGTLRNLGHCRAWKQMADLGLFDRDDHPQWRGLTHAAYMGQLTGTDGTPAAVAARLRVPGDAPVIRQLEWLGMFSNEPVAQGITSPVDVMAALMAERCAYRDGERDMLVMVHKFDAAYPDASREEITSQLVDFGIPGGDSSMARTVSLPAAAAVRLVADGRIGVPGVHIPVSAALYEPILAELATLGIELTEKRRKTGSR